MLLMVTPVYAAEENAGTENDAAITDDASYTQELISENENGSEDLTAGSADPEEAGSEENTDAETEGGDMSGDDVSGGTAPEGDAAGTETETEETGEAPGTAAEEKPEEAGESPETAAEDDQTENAPAENEDRPLEEKASDYVTITVYNRQTSNWGEIYLVEGFQYPTNPSREMKISGASSSSNNIRIESVEWLKQNSSGQYVADTSSDHKFSAGRWRCDLKLSGCSELNIHNSQSGLGNIRFSGFPSGTEWQGDGNSNGNITYHTTFTVTKPEQITRVDLVGDLYEEPKLDGTLVMPSFSLSEDAVSKGVRIKERKWIKRSGASAWYNGQTAYAGDTVKMDYYYLTVALACSDPGYALSESTEVRYYNGKTDFRFSSETKLQSDGSLLAGKFYTVSTEKDGLYYMRSHINVGMNVTVYSTRTTISGDVVIPSSVTFGGETFTVAGISGRAFADRKVESVFVPATVFDIGDTFVDCTNLKTVTFEEGINLPSIPEAAFESCSSLTQISIPDGVEKIDESAFRSCTSLQKVYLPLSVNWIKEGAFAYCSALTDVYYDGTGENWIDIDIISDSNSSFLGANIHYAPSSVTGISLDKKELKLPAGESVKLTAAVTPAEGNDPTLKWTSSNKKLATVDFSGKVTALSQGTVTITATAKNGKKATCRVDVLFKDVTDPGKAAYTAIYALAAKDIVKGYGSYFDIDGNCTRAQFVLFLWRYAGKPAPKSTDLKFKDAAAIKALAPDYTKAIAWGVEKGVVAGFTSGANAGKFCPNDPCTRGQVVLFLWRYKGRPSSSASITFKDAAEINAMAQDYKKAIAWAVAKKITTGFPDNTFRPNANCTRGQCVTFLYRVK